MTCTFYTDDGLAANGRTYQENQRTYGDFCASNRYGLGSRLLVSCGGRRVHVTVVDRIGHGTQCDLCTAAFRHLAGRRWQAIGRLTVRVRLLHSSRHKMTGKMISHN